MERQAQRLILHYFELEASTFVYTATGLQSRVDRDFTYITTTQSKAAGSRSIDPMRPAFRRRLLIGPSCHRMAPRALVLRKNVQDDSQAG